MNTSPTIGTARRYDAIVVGARAAGAATAMLLGRSGQRVLMVDRAAYGADTLSTQTIVRAGVVQLHRWGLLDVLRTDGTPPIRRTNIHYGDEIVSVDIRDEDGADALYAPRRTVLDPVLVDAAWDAGVEVVYGTRARAVLRDRDGRVTGIVARGADGTEAIAEADVVIGADGVSSTFAQLVAAPTTYERPEAGATIYGYFPFLGSTLELYFQPDVTAGVIPTNGGIANVFVGLPGTTFRELKRGRDVETMFWDTLRRAAPQAAEMFQAAGCARQYRSFPGHPGYLRQAHGPGWALVGDAGSFKDPITAHGITDALRDAELLARSLIQTGDGAAYEAARDALARPFLDVTSDIASYNWNIPELMQLHRRMRAVTEEEQALVVALDSDLVAA
ncbi:MAG TPA: NAD(P)/FAD-dependent oxidoreductase [Acidimicrobiia bacterium]|jgi:flavin-dependent dehydrogenase|nr:NAD(P)/FAD-dependent oxidoreductase [Acidimicrobiia bacterium]